MRDKDLYDDASTIATDEQLAVWKAKLVIATNHADRMAGMKSMLSKEMKGRKDHYSHVASALARCIRDKSSLPLEHEFGDRAAWTVSRVEPREVFCDSLRVWLDAELTRERGEDVE